jgi:hypothetical protein
MASSYAPRGAASTYTVTALKRWSCSDELPLPPVSAVRAIHVYDFDNTLFASPLPNKQVWQASAVSFLSKEDAFVGGGWWHDPNLLAATGAGVEVEEPRAWAGWWNETVASLCDTSAQQSDVVSVLLTGRGESRFGELIKRMVKAKGLGFHMVCLKPKTGPAKQTFKSTMAFKQELLKDILYTYAAAEELRIYEDRPRHVDQFRQFFTDFNRALMSPNPPHPRNTIAAEVVEVVTKAKQLDPVQECVEIMKMLNAHNSAYKSRLHPGMKPYEIKKQVLSTGYVVSSKQWDHLVALVPPAVRTSKNYNVQAQHIAISIGATPKHVLDAVGGEGREVRWRVTGLGVLDNKLWAATVEPVNGEKVLTLNKPASIILAMGTKASPKDVSQIRDWTPVSPGQAVDFDTVVAERYLLNIVVESKKGDKTDELGSNEDFVGIEGAPVPQSRRQKWQAEHQGGGNYRGGSALRGRGQNRRDEISQRGRGRGGNGFNARGGARGRGRGGGSHQNDRREGGGDHRPSKL